MERRVVIARLAGRLAEIQREHPVRDRYTRRYMPGQRLYLDAAHPRERADAVLWNDDPQRPRLAFKSG